MGVEPQLSRDMINNLFIGSSELLNFETLDIPVLVDQVTSKRGVTIEAVNVYKDAKLDQITSRAIDAALLRTEQIIEELK
jgi:pyrroline-5-carboxylate reductase